MAWLNERFRATESVERVILDEAECTYLYAEGDRHILCMATMGSSHFRRHDRRMTISQDGIALP